MMHFVPGELLPSLLTTTSSSSLLLFVLLPCCRIRPLAASWSVALVRWRRWRPRRRCGQRWNSVSFWDAWGLSCAVQTSNFRQACTGLCFVPSLFARFSVGVPPYRFASTMCPTTSVAKFAPASRWPAETSASTKAPHATSNPAAPATTLPSTPMKRSCNAIPAQL